MDPTDSAINLVPFQCAQKLTSRWLGAYIFNEYGPEELAMPRAAVDDNRRMSLRVRPEQKATLLRAAALENTDLTDFVLRNALREAEAIIEQADHVKLSARDNLLVLDLLENPPPPNAKLRAAARAMPKSA